MSRAGVFEAEGGRASVGAPGWVVGQELRVYADTSVFGGVLDEEFAAPSRTFFEQVLDGRFGLVTSATVWRELQGAPPRVRAFAQALEEWLTIVEASEEALALRDAYLAAAVVSDRWKDDALHVAIATVERCAALVSWNFRHHVHFRRIQAYNGVNAVQGLPPIAIHTPWEVIRYEDEEV